MSSMLFLFFLPFFLCSFITALGPTDLNLRVTKHSANLMKDVTVALMEAMVDVSFPDIGVPVVKHIKELTITAVQVKKDQTSVSFQTEPNKNGLIFEIKDFTISIKYYTESFQIIGGSKDRPNTYTGNGVGARITVTLENHRGQLHVTFPNCEFTMNRLKWSLLDTSISVFIKAKFCSFLESHAVPAINSMLDKSLTKIPLPSLPNAKNLFMDFSLTEDIAWHQHSFDVPFKALVYTGGHDMNKIPPGVTPVFTESDLMAYVGVSEFFLNSAASALYQANAMVKEQVVSNTDSKGLLKFLQFFKQPLKLKKDLYDSLKVTELPTISITEKNGINVKVRAKLQASSGATREESQQFLAVSANCEGQIKVDFTGNLLTLPSNEIKCVIVTKNKFRDWLVKDLNDHLSDGVTSFLQSFFSKGIPIPTLLGVSFTKGTIKYFNGYMVAGGDFTLTQDFQKNIKNLLKPNVG